MYTVCIICLSFSIVPQVLEVVDDKLEKTDVTFVKFSDDDFAEEEFGLTEEDLPKLYFFDNQIPVKYLENRHWTLRSF